MSTTHPSSGGARYFPVHCPTCEWRGSSERTICHQNAGGDFDDPQCPECEGEVEEVSAETVDFGSAIVALKHWLPGIQHNISVYERMSEYSITPESRAVTLNDLRNDEAGILVAIDLLRQQGCVSDQKGERSEVGALADGTPVERGAGNSADAQQHPKEQPEASQQGLSDPPLTTFRICDIVNKYTDGEPFPFAGDFDNAEHFLQFLHDHGYPRSQEVEPKQ